MPYCPDCRFEYKEDVSKCPDCGADLVDELPKESTPGSPNFVPLRNLPSRFHAQMLEEALKNEGIPSMIKGDELAIISDFNSPRQVTIWVSEKDAERAEEIADQMLDHI